MTGNAGAHYEVLVPAVIPPPAPTDLEACRESGSPPNVCNYLSWTGSAGVTGSPAVSFNVYRSSTSPVPIDAGHRIASGLTGTDYTDCGNVNNRFWQSGYAKLHWNHQPDPERRRHGPQQGAPLGLALSVY